MTDHVAGSIWFGLGGMIGILAALFFLEGYLLWTGQAPITVYVRNWTWGHMFAASLFALLLVAGAAAAFTHFIFDG